MFAHDTCKSRVADTHPFRHMTIIVIQFAEQYQGKLAFYSVGGFVQVMSPNLINPLLNPCNINSMA
jgi:hypothetical protein